MIKKMNILVFGDSIVYGIGDNEKGGWVNRLRLKLEERNDYYYDIYNLGIPDDTSKDLLKRYKKEIKARFYQGELAIIFSIGANDSSQTNISIKQFKKNIKKLIRYTKKKTNKVLFISLPKATNSEIEGRKGIIAKINNDKIKKFNFAIKEVCEQEKTDFLSLKQKIELYDTVHPNSNGYEYISNKIYNYIKRKGE